MSRSLYGAVSAMNDEGNTVVFSRKWGNYVENDSTGERIEMERVGDTFEMVLKVKAMPEGTRKVVSWANDGGKRYEGMEVDGVSEDEGPEVGNKEVVFNRRMR